MGEENKEEVPPKRKSWTGLVELVSAVGGGIAEAQVLGRSGDSGPGHGSLTAVQWESHLPPPSASPLGGCSPNEAEICSPVLHELEVICNKNVMQIILSWWFLLFMCCLLSSLDLIRLPWDLKSISAPTKATRVTLCGNCGDDINQVRLVTLCFDSDPGLSFTPFPWAHSLILVLSTFILW